MSGSGEGVEFEGEGPLSEMVESEIKHQSVLGISTMTRVLSTLSTPADENVGFYSLPDQAMVKSTERGFVFNILCVGETGIGKSTLIDSLFNSSFPFTKSAVHNHSEVSLEINSHELMESNVTLKLTVVESKGYGDQINKTDTIEPILKYVDDQMEEYLQEELKVNRCLALHEDTRIHACIFLIAPTGYGLKALDLECLKKLDSKVNVIPVIAKSDAIAKSDLSFFKQKVLEDLKSHGINYYQFPVDDETIVAGNEAMNNSIPFAVVGSTEFVQSGKAEVRGRSYPWGSVEVNKDTHSDFPKLREAIIRTNMLDLFESTHHVHFEIYRQQRLANLGYDVSFDFDTSRTGHSCSLRALVKRQEAEMTLRIRTRLDGWLQNEFKALDERETEIAESKKAADERYREQVDNLDTEMRSIVSEFEEFQTLTKKFLSTGRKSLPNLPKTTTLGRLGMGFNSLRH